MRSIPAYLLAALFAAVAGAPAAWAQTSPTSYPYNPYPYTGQVAGTAGALPTYAGATGSYGYNGYPGYNTPSQYGTYSSLNNYQQYSYYGQPSYGQPGYGQYAFGQPGYGQIGTPTTFNNATQSAYGQPNAYGYGSTIQPYGYAGGTSGGYSGYPPFGAPAGYGGAGTYAGPPGTYGWGAPGPAGAAPPYGPAPVDWSAGQAANPYAYNTPASPYTEAPTTYAGYNPALYNQQAAQMAQQGGSGSNNSYTLGQYFYGIGVPTNTPYMGSNQVTPYNSGSLAAYLTGIPSASMQGGAPAPWMQQPANPGQ
jgi:hypothetical protein